jgi:hypothetical protein
MNSTLAINFSGQIRDDNIMSVTLAQVRTEFSKNGVPYNKLSKFYHLGISFDTREACK